MAFGLLIVTMPFAPAWPQWLAQECARVCPAQIMTMKGSRLPIWAGKWARAPWSLPALPHDTFRPSPGGAAGANR